MKRLITLLIIIAASWQIGQAQQYSKTQIEEIAAESKANENWPKALTYYKQLIDIDSTGWYYYFQAGQAARHMRLYDMSEMLLESIPDEQRMDALLPTNFWLGSIHKALGEYDAAIGYFERYKAQDATNVAELQARATLEIETCEWAALQEPKNMNIIHLDTTVNSYYSDIAPYRRGDSFRYTSVLNFSEDANLTPKTTVLGIQPRAKAADDLKLRVLERFMDEEYKEIPSMAVALDVAESPYHHANYSMNDSGSRFYFNFCSDGEKANEFICEIHVCDCDEEGNVSNCRKLGEQINKPNYTATHPYEGYDPLTGQDYLFFSSNRDGGKGNLDIWCSYINADGEFSAPVALENINSEQDDMTPYFHASTQTLYYSSGGFQNFGGMDLFTTKKSGDEWSTPENMGMPINSGYDDLYYNFDPISGTSYFASNRPGTLCNAPDDDCTCTDIYEAEILVDLDVLTFNAVDDSALAGCTVELFNMTTGKRDTFFINETGNDFYFPKLELESEYKITATKEGFTTASTTVSTVGIVSSQTLKERLVLAPAIDLIVNTYDAITRLPLGGTTISLFDLMASMDSTIVNLEASNQCGYPLNYGRDYRVEASKRGYEPDGASFTTIGRNMPGTIVKDLYLTPFTEVTLYFDNDYPIPNSYATKCPINLDYGVTYTRYAKLDQSFADNYAVGKNNKDAARQEVADFFANDVLKGFNDLERYLALLEGYLSENKDIRVVVVMQGYASPLAKNDYNKYLTQRRISCVQNHFKNNNDKALLTYINNGRLTFKEVPNGEETAIDKGISDDIDNASESIYSPSASRERRVKILRFEIIEKDGFSSTN